MEKIIRDVLLDLGLTTKEVLFFLTNYKLGAATINDIAKKARIERSTAYLIAQQLLAKGFLLEDFKQYKKSLITIEPKTLLRMAAARQRQIGRHELALKENLPQLQTVYQASETRPKMRSFEGKNGLLSVRRDILELSQEILLWTNQKTESMFFTQEYHQNFITERIRKEIAIRVLAVNNKQGAFLQKNSEQQLRQMKLLPKDVFFSAETYIYGNKVAIIDYNKDIIGIIIESEQIATAQRAIFEMTWNTL